MGKATSKLAASEPPGKPELRLLKVSSCPSLSGKSELSYHIGCTADLAVHFRVTANNGGGLFNPDWVPLSVIQKAFSTTPAGETITSFALRSIFIHRSANSPSFLMAALLNEGLVATSATKPRCYETSEAREFFAEINALIAQSSHATDSTASASLTTVPKAAKPARTVKPSKLAHSATRKAAPESGAVVPLHDSQPPQE